MKPCKFMESNCILTPAPGTEDRVQHLHVFRDGKEIISCWELSDLDRQRIASGSPVWLRVFSGETSYPVCVTTDDPFIPENSVS